MPALSIRGTTWPSPPPAKNKQPATSRDANPLLELKPASSHRTGHEPPAGNPLNVSLARDDYQALASDAAERHSLAGVETIGDSTMYREV